MTTVLSKYEKFGLDNTKRFYIQNSEYDRISYQSIDNSQNAHCSHDETQAENARPIQYRRLPTHFAQRQKNNARYARQQMTILVTSIGWNTQQH